MYDRVVKFVYLFFGQKKRVSENLQRKFTLVRQSNLPKVGFFLAV